MPEIFDEKLVKARKRHVCCECKSPIFKGEQYYYAKGLWDGEFMSFKTHKDCHDLHQMIEHDFTDAWSEPFAYGDLGEHIIEYLGETYINPYRSYEHSITGKRNYVILDRKAMSEIKLKYEFNKL